MNVGLELHDHLLCRRIFRHFAVGFVNDVDYCALEVCVANFRVMGCVWKLTPIILMSDFVVAKPHVVRDVC